MLRLTPSLSVALVLGFLTPGCAKGLSKAKKGADSPDGGSFFGVDGGFSSADAAPLNPADAAPHIDAGATCTNQTVNLLANANFDAGRNNGWGESSVHGYDVVVNQSTLSISADTPAFLAHMGDDDNVDASVWQDVQVPGDATGMHLTGKYWIRTGDLPGDYDDVYIEIDDTGGNKLEQLAHWSNLDTTDNWTAFNAPAGGNYQGQTIRLRIHGLTDGSYSTGYVFDTLNLEVTTCR